jgi:hypothetical protein
MGMKLPGFGRALGNMRGGINRKARGPQDTEAGAKPAL